MSGVDEARAALQAAQLALQAATAKRDSANLAATLAAEAVAEASAALAAYDRAQRDAGQDLADVIRARAAGNSVAEARGAVVSGDRDALVQNLGQAMTAQDLLGGELKAAEEDLAQKGREVDDAARNVLAAHAAGLVVEAQTALATLRRVRSDLVALSTASYGPTAQGLRPITLSPAGQSILRWDITSGDAQVAQPARVARAEVWRAYRQQLLTNSAAAAPLAGQPDEAGS